VLRRQKFEPLNALADGGALVSTPFPLWAGGGEGSCEPLRASFVV